MMTTLSTKGQVVLPQAARRKLGLHPGARFACAVRDGGIFLKPERSKPARVTIGKSKHSGLPVLVVAGDTPLLTRATVRALLTAFP